MATDMTTDEGKSALETVTKVCLAFFNWIILWEFGKTGVSNRKGV